MVEKEEQQESPAMPASNPCATPDCPKPATMQCPTCIKLSLPSTYFCGQECFAGFWKFHKMAHKKPDLTNTLASNGLFTGPLRPYPRTFTGLRPIPANHPKPDYATSGSPNQHFQALANKSVPYADDDDLELLRATCLIARKALDAGHAIVAPGVTTEEIDTVVHEYIIDAGAYPSPRNYYNFPRSCCTSVNEIICHGIPDTRPLQDGDILNLDVTAYFNGMHGDLNETYLVGNVAESSKSLVVKTYESLMKSIEYCQPNKMYREIGNIIANTVEPHGYSVVRSYTGHGIGRIFHQAPNVPHYRSNKAVGFMKKGHVFTIEPMVN